MELADVAEELYQVAPEDFVASRTARQDEAKAAGDRALATDIGSLPKPSLAAWVCNLLVRAHHEEIRGLVELGGLLRDAQQNLAGDELRALNTQRGRLLDALTRQAAALARERGHRIGSGISTQVEETLRAAMADPEAGEALLTGRLSAPMSYSGLGAASVRPDLRLVPPPKPEKAAPPTRSASPRARETTAERRERAREEERKAAEERRRRELERAREAAAAAETAAQEAQAAADQQRREAEALAVEHADLRARVDELADELADAERHAAEAAAALKRAQRRSAAPERDAAEAAEARDRPVAAAAHLEAETPG